MAKEIIRATAESIGGIQVKCEARGLSFILDEPIEAGGTNIGMNPMECLLSALGGCKIIVAKMFAKAKGIKLNNIKLEFEGTFDIDGCMDKNPDARVGYSQIVTKYYMDADNSLEELEAFAEFIDTHCPVMDTVVNGTNPIHEVHKI